MVQADGGRAIVIPVPDEGGDLMQEQMCDQTTFMTGCVYNEKRLFDGNIVSSFSVGR
jgi:hypothetical protein